MPDALRELERTVLDRRDRHPEGSYTAELLQDPDRVARKIMEEAFEVCLELGRATVDHDRVAEEAADLLYHLVVGLASVGVSLDAVERVLVERRR